MIHSDVELKKQYSCTEAEASLAKGALDAVCNYLEKNALHLQERRPLSHAHAGGNRASGN